MAWGEVQAFLRSSQLPYIYYQLIFNKDIFSGERTDFLVNGAERPGYPHAKNEAGPCVHTIYKKLTPVGSKT